MVGLLAYITFTRAREYLLEEQLLRSERKPYQIVKRKPYKVSKRKIVRHIIKNNDKYPRRDIPTITLEGTIISRAPHP